MPTESSLQAVEMTEKANRAHEPAPVIFEQISVIEQQLEHIVPFSEVSYMKVSYT